MTCKQKQGDVYCCSLCLRIEDGVKGAVVPNGGEKGRGNSPQNAQIVICADMYVTTACWLIL